MLRFLCMMLMMMASNAFVVQAPLRAVTAQRTTDATMGPAKDGPFTPIVLAAKVVLGEKTLGKVRGKGIAYHSQEINKFCEECKYRHSISPQSAEHAVPQLPSPRSQEPISDACLPTARSFESKQTACRRSSTRRSSRRRKRLAAISASFRRLATLLALRSTALVDLDAGAGRHARA